MLDAQRRDPEIVLGNRLALLFKSKPEPRIHRGRSRRDVQDLASGHEHFDFGKILHGAPGIESAVAQFADNGNWKQKLFDGLRKEIAGLAGENRYGDIRIERNAIATHEDRRARIRAR